MRSLAPRTGTRAAGAPSPSQSIPGWPQGDRPCGAARGDGRSVRTTRRARRATLPRCANPRGGDRVRDRGLDLAAVAHDADVAEQPLHVDRSEAGDRCDVEPRERLPEALALSEDRQPRQPRLEPLQTQLLEEAIVVEDRSAPFVVVIGDVVGCRGAPTAPFAPVGADNQIVHAPEHARGSAATAPRRPHTHDRRGRGLRRRDAAVRRMVRAAPHAAAAHTVPPDGVALDIGANAGAIALSMAHLAPRGEVFAFEAAPPNADRLETNVASAGMANVHVERIALYDRRGELALSYLDEHSGGANAPTLWRPPRRGSRRSPSTTGPAPMISPGSTS